MSEPILKALRERELKRDAAPELYEALDRLSKEIRCIHEYADFGGKVGAALKAADVVLKKARGEAS